MSTQTQIPETIEFTRIANDVNGNPRYVCHFLDLLNEGDNIKAKAKGTGFLDNKYQIALNKAKAIGGRKFHNKQYGGGIVFQSYNTPDLEQAIKKAQRVNTNFLTAWQPYDKLERKAKRAIYSHFSQYTYQWQADNDAASKRPFNCLNFAQIDSLLGLAYTSTGDYAGLWICNAGYLWADETHYFIGFAINTDGKVVGIALDENENEIFIEL